MTSIQTFSGLSGRGLALQTRGLSAAAPTVTMNRRNDETIQEYERPIPGVTGRDVFCAWIVVATFLLGLLVLSVV